MPWSISQPSLSAWRSSASAATSARVGARPGTSVGRVVDQPLDAHELAPPVGQPVVERAGMAAQEGEARVARGLLDGLGGVEAAAIALGLGGQAGEPFLGLAPIGREGGGIGREVAVCDRCRDHRIHVVLPVLTENWSGRRDLNPRPTAWEADALPLSYTRVDVILAHFTGP